MRELGEDQPTFLMYGPSQLLQTLNMFIAADRRLLVVVAAASLDVHVPGDEQARSPARQRAIESDQLRGHRARIAGHRLGGSCSYEAIAQLQAADVAG